MPTMSEILMSEELLCIYIYLPLDLWRNGRIIMVPSYLATELKNSNMINIVNDMRNKCALASTRITDTFHIQCIYM
jgi:hypothetical protein